jgi:hypothetical protein
MRSTLLISVAVTLAGCTIHDYDYDAASYGGSASAGTTGGYEDQVASFPGTLTLGIASDGTNVYVATQDSQTGVGSIVRVDGSTNALTLANAEDQPYAIATDELFVYYTLAGGGVHKVKKNGGSFPVSLTDASSSGGGGGGGSTDQDGGSGGSGNADGGGAVDGGAADDAGASTNDGGSGVDAGAGSGSGSGNGGGAGSGSAGGVQAAYGIALSSDNVYYTANDGVHRVSKVGGDDTLLVPDLAGADAIVADDTAIYWMDHGGSANAATGAIKRADLATGAVSTLADGLNLSGASTFSLVGDATSLYFAEPGKSRVYRINKADGNTTMLATATNAPSALAVDDANVYIATQGSVYSGGTAFSIESASKTGTNQVTFVATTINAYFAAMVVDSSYVWFTTRDDGAIDRVFKYGTTYPQYGAATNGSSSTSSP